MINEASDSDIGHFISGDPFVLPQPLVISEVVIDWLD
jgi:hypothetical protein